MIINVTDSAGLASALKAAQDGDTISLSAGEYVMTNKIQGVSYAQGITITSADVNHQAVVDGVYFQNASGVTLSNLQIKVDPRQTVAVIVQDSDHVTLDHLDIVGTAVGVGSGVRVNGGTQVVISNSEVHNLSGGITLSNSDAVSVLNNRIHDIEVDGVQSLGSSDVKVSGNFFTNFYPKAGDHSDAIQFVGSAVQAHDITITDNTYVRGVGLANTQGIFMGDEGGTAAPNYENVTIAGNTIVGAVYHGISVYGADHLDLNHNTVEGYVDQTSWIMVTDSTHSTETDNIATTLNPGVGNVGLVTSGNTTIAAGAVGDTAVLTAHDLSVNQGSAAVSVAGPSGNTGAPIASASASASTGSGSVSAAAAPAIGQCLSASTAVTQAIGGAGDDTVVGTSASDYLRGMDGNDSIQGGFAFDDINGNKGNDTIDGGSGGNDWLVGGQGDDAIFAHHGQNLIYGNLGNDTLSAGDGGDVVRGGQGDDSLVGGSGNDFISGDRGNDTERGGAGADTFHGSQDAGIDRVLDFNPGEGDHVQLDAGTTYTLSQMGSDTVIDMGGVVW